MWMKGRKILLVEFFYETKWVLKIIFVSRQNAIRIIFLQNGGMEGEGGGLMRKEKIGWR
jgi:hypothetical protein